MKNIIEKLNTINESIIDFRRKELCKEVWEVRNRSYKLKKEIRNTILNDLEDTIQPHYKIWMIGSITGYYYNERTDIDIHIIPTETVKEYDKIKEILKNKNSKVKQHPIQYYMHEHQEVPYADGIYDIKNEKWLKWKDIEKPNLQQYYEKFRETVDKIDIKKAELYRDLVDHRFIKDIMKNKEEIADQEINNIETELEKTIEDIDLKIEELVKQYEEIKDRRSQALQKDFQKEIEKNYGNAIEKYSSKQLLPDAVTSKLLEKYHYKSFLKEIKELKKSIGTIDDDSDVDKITKIFKKDGQDL